MEPPTFLLVARPELPPWVFLGISSLIASVLAIAFCYHALARTRTRTLLISLPTRPKRKLRVGFDAAKGAPIFTVDGPGSRTDLGNGGFVHPEV